MRSAEFSFRPSSTAKRWNRFRNRFCLRHLAEETSFFDAQLQVGQLASSAGIAIIP